MYTCRSSPSPRTTEAESSHQRSPAALDTSIAGEQTVTVAVTDLAGNTSSVDCAYQVNYTVRAITPIPSGLFRSAPANTTVPFKFPVVDANGAAVTGNIVAAAISTATACPGRFTLRTLSAWWLPTGASNLGSRFWYLG